MFTLPVHYVLHFDSFSYWMMIGIIVLGGCSDSAESNIKKESPREYYVQVEELKPTKAPLPVIASGVLASKSEINLSFKIGGYVEDIPVEEGETVRQGELLARLDQSEIDAQVAKARNAFEKAKRDLNRIRNLYRDTVATLEQVQDLETAYGVAEAELKIARFNQKNAAIFAPDNGRILARYAEEEEQVAPGAPVVQLGRYDKTSHVFKFGVADRDVVRIQPRDSAHIRFDVWSRRIFPAEVSVVAAAADPHSGAFEIEVMLNDYIAELRNGFVGKITLYPSGQAPYLRIPMDALVEADRENAFIYVPDKAMETVKRVRVEPFYIGDSFFAIDAREFPSGFHVVTRGAAYLRPGATVHIVNRKF